MFKYKPVAQSLRKILQRLLAFCTSVIILALQLRFLDNRISTEQSKVQRKGEPTVKQEDTKILPGPVTNPGLAHYPGCKPSHACSTLYVRHSDKSNTALLQCRYAAILWIHW